MTREPLICRIGWAATEVLALILFLTMLWTWLAILATAASAAECRPGPGRGVDGHWWHYRVVDGRHCWYLGTERERPRQGRQEGAHARVPTPLPRKGRPEPASEAPVPALRRPNPAEVVASMFGPDGDAAVKVAAAEDPRTLADLARLSDLPRRAPGVAANDAPLIPDVPAVPKATCPVAFVPAAEVKIVRETSWAAVTAAFVGTAAGSSLIWIGALWWERRRRRADDAVREELDLIHDQWREGRGSPFSFGSDGAGLER